MIYRKLECRLDSVGIFLLKNELFQGALSI